MGALDGHPEGAGLQQTPQALQVVLGWHRHDVMAPRSFAGCAERRGPAAVVLEDARVGVEAFWGVGNEVEEGLDALRVALVHKRADVGLALEYLAHAEVSQVVLVFGQARGYHRGTGISGELDGAGAHAAVGSYHQDGIPFRDA